MFDSSRGNKKIECNTIQRYSHHLARVWWPPASSGSPFFRLCVFTLHSALQMFPLFVCFSTFVSYFFFFLLSSVPVLPTVTTGSFLSFSNTARRSWEWLTPRFHHGCKSSQRHFLLVGTKLSTIFTSQWQKMVFQLSFFSSQFCYFCVSGLPALRARRSKTKKTVFQETVETAKASLVRGRCPQVCRLTGWKLKKDFPRKLIMWFLFLSLAGRSRIAETLCHLEIQSLVPEKLFLLLKSLRAHGWNRNGSGSEESAQRDALQLSQILLFMHWTAERFQIHKKTEVGCLFEVHKHC